MVLKFFRWLFGYVSFKVTGSFPERFINLIAKNGFCLWNVKNKNNILESCMTVSQYKQIRPLARKSRVSLKIKKKCGFPFIINKYKHRTGILVGLLAFFSIIHFLSMYIWCIDVKGISNIPEGEVIKAVSDFGLTKGHLKKDINIDMVEQKTMMRLQDVAWISINITGNYAEVSIRERVIPPDIVPKNKPCNIKAKIDGQIDRMEVYKGTAMVKNGDAVLKDRVLVSGIVEDAFGGTTVQHADAKIFAYTTHRFYEKINLNQTRHEKTGKILKRRKAELFGLSIPLNLMAIPNDMYELSVNRHNLCVNNVYLPLVFYTENWSEFLNEDIEISKDEARLQAEKKLSEKEQTELKDVEIIGKNKVENADGFTYELEISYYCRENIAYFEEIPIENN